MKTPVESLPTRIEKGGVRFQNVAWNELCVTHVELPKGTDAAPLLEGMPDNLCPCPHWGYVKKGSVHVRFADGREETVRAGDVYHWPPGHTVSTDEDYESVEFSPAAEMTELLNKLASKLGQ